jgi:hypothetical protein
VQDGAFTLGEGQLNASLFPEKSPLDTKQRARSGMLDKAAFLC